MYRFNTQPPEGGCDPDMLESIALTVSTHSRPKAAGCYIEGYILTFRFQHTAARRRLLGLFFFASDNLQVSTHSRPKAAALLGDKYFAVTNVSTHSRPKAAVFQTACCMMKLSFQHTAARRRLVIAVPFFFVNKGFNTQPPEGGCFSLTLFLDYTRFQHTAARRRLNKSQDDWQTA